MNKPKLFLQNPSNYETVSVSKSGPVSGGSVFPFIANKKSAVPVRGRPPGSESD